MTPNPRAGIDCFIDLVGAVRRHFPLSVISDFGGTIAAGEDHLSYPTIDFEITVDDLNEGLVDWVRQLIGAWNKGKEVHWEFLPNERLDFYSLRPVDYNTQKSMSRLYALRRTAGDLARFIEAWAAGNPKE